MQYTYIQAWMGRALFANGLSPFYDPDPNFPDGVSQPVTDAPYFMVLLLAPVTLLFGEVFSYNLTIWLGYFLSGLFTYLWVKRLTGSRLAGLVAGLVFCLVPYRVAHSKGHLNLVSTQFIPLFFWALDEILRVEKPRLAGLGWLGVTVFLIGSASQYYLVICLFLGAIYVLLSRFQVKYLVNQGWKLITSVGVGGIISSWPYLLISRKVSFVPYTTEWGRIGSASLADFFVPSYFHPLWGEAISRLYPRSMIVEFSLYLGTIALALALIALLKVNTLRGAQKRVWIGVILAGLVMALGTDLHLALGIPVQAENPIWLPAYYFSKLPLINLMRIWARFAIVPMFFIAALAGMGVHFLYEKLRVNTLVISAIILLLMLDMLPGNIYAVKLKVRPIDKWLARRADNLAVGFLPAGVENYLALYGSLYHDHPFTAYGHPEHLPPAFLNYKRLADQLPDAIALDRIHQSGIGYLIVKQSAYDGNVYPAWEEFSQALEASPLLDITDDVDGFVIYMFRRK